MNRVIKRIFAVFFTAAMAFSMALSASATNVTDSLPDTDSLTEYQEMLDGLKAEYGAELTLIGQPEESVEELRAFLLPIVQASAAAAREAEIIEATEEFHMDYALLPRAATKIVKMSKTYLTCTASVTTNGESVGPNLRFTNLSNVNVRSNPGLSWTKGALTSGIYDSGKSISVHTSGILQVSASVKFDNYTESFQMNYTCVV